MEKLINSLSLERFVEVVFKTMDHVFYFPQAAEDGNKKQVQISLSPSFAMKFRCNNIDVDVDVFYIDSQLKLANFIEKILR